MFGQSSGRVGRVGEHDRDPQHDQARKEENRLGVVAFENEVGHPRGDEEGEQET